MKLTAKLVFQLCDVGAKLGLKDNADAFLNARQTLILPIGKRDAVSNGLRRVLWIGVVVGVGQAVVFGGNVKMHQVGHVVDM